MTIQKKAAFGSKEYPLLEPEGGGGGGGGGGDMCMAPIKVLTVRM